MKPKRYVFAKVNRGKLLRGCYLLILFLFSFFIIGKSLLICLDMGMQENIEGSVLSEMNHGLVRLFGQIFPLLRYEEEYGGSQDYVYESDIPDYFYEDEDTKSQETILALEGGENGPQNVDMASGADTSNASETVKPPNAVPSSGAVTFTEEQLKDFDFLYNNFYVVDSSTTLLKSELQGEKLLKQDLSIDTGSSDYKILIYHTHGSEAFADSREGVIEDSIIGVGDVLTEVIETKYNIHLYHDRTVYDVVDGKLDRSYAYTLSKKGVKQILADHPSIEVIIDLHRDGVSESTHLVTEINGKPTAKVMFLNGVSRFKNSGDISYLYNPYKETNLALSLQMFVAGKALYGDFLRKIYIRAYCYNLNLMPKATLIEAGAQTNTVEEEKNAMEPLADILYNVLSPAS